jgi:hypothetical protein
MEEVMDVEEEDSLDEEVEEEDCLDEKVSVD